MFWNFYFLCYITLKEIRNGMLKYFGKHIMSQLLCKMCPPKEIMTNPIVFPNESFF